MNIPAHLQAYSFNGNTVNVFVPDATALQQWYRQTASNNPIHFPYWGKIWPAAKALSSFISLHPQYVQNKKVLELAAGVGLPSLLTAFYATEVCSSDYIPEAVECMQQSIKENNLLNISARVLDWNHLPEDLSAEVLLLSDINYEPQAFENLHKVLLQFLQKNTVILLSTPHRLMAKPFIGKLLLYCIQQEEITVSENGTETNCSVLVLQKLKER